MRRLRSRPEGRRYVVDRFRFETFMFGVVLPLMIVVLVLLFFAAIILTVMGR